jgi:HAD superfamily hydrolase (TIGR01490 family)
MLKGEHEAFPPLTIPGFVAFESCKNRNLERGYYMLMQQKKMKKANIVLFDMDHTLLLGDAVNLWSHFLNEKGIMTADDWDKRNKFDEDYRAHCLDVDASFEFELSLLKRVPIVKRQRWRDEFFEKMIRSKISKIGLNLIQEYKARCNVIVILITATHVFLASPVAQYVGVHYMIATVEEMENEDYTGKVLGMPNIGEGKLKNFQMWLEKNNIEPGYTVLYSDSINDLPLLSQVDKPIVVDPDPLLKEIALQKNWEIISFKTEGKVKQKITAVNL